jgi:hypothetical protein
MSCFRKNTSKEEKIRTVIPTFDFYDPRNGPSRRVLVVESRPKKLPLGSPHRLNLKFREFGRLDVVSFDACMKLLC